MNCEQATDLAALAASDDVTLAERRALESHNAGCPDCRAEAMAFEELCGQMTAMREESVPDHVFAAVRARVVSEIGDRSWRRWVGAWAGVTALCVCGLVAAVAFRPGLPAAKPVFARVEIADVRGSVPEAPVAAPRRPRKPSKRVAARKSDEPLVVKMLTDDPDVVIYWIADAEKGAM